MEYVTPQYDQLLTNLSESIRQQRRAQFLEQLAETATAQAFIPEQSAHAETVVDLVA